MSTPRRLFEDPRNTYIVDNDDPGAFDKRFVGRPGVHREQRCCRDCAPVWDTHRVQDDDENADRNFTAYLKSDPLQVQDATGESDDIDGRRVVGTDTHGNNIYTQDMKGYVWVEGPKSGYRPPFVDVEEWMRWQGVHWIPSPTGVPGLPNPPRWVRMPGERKVKWGLGRGSWGSYDWTFLWCEKCETSLEKGWSDVLEGLPTAARGIAMIASYVPVFGTAVSYLINTGVSLAEGETIDQALLDGIGGALPGQPTSGIIFNAGVAIAKGERIDHALIDGLPVDKNVKSAIKVVDDLVYGIASGENVTDAAYKVIRDQLPPEAQQGMDIARRIIEEKNPQIVLSEAEQAVVNAVREDAREILEAAKDKGADALNIAEAQVDSIYNQYAADTGYQMAVDRLSPEERGSLTLGLAGGAMLRPAQVVGRFGSAPESNVDENNSWEEKGKRLMAGGIRFRLKLVSDISMGSSFTIAVDDFDALNGVWRKVVKTYQITDAWRRGFAVAIGVCEGTSEGGPGQTKVYQTMAENGGRAGFEAGQALQHERTLHGDSGQLSATLVVHTAVAHVAPPEDAGRLSAKTALDAPTVDRAAQKWRPGR
ncbi:MAG TPA: hypothetical protein VHM31_21430 [Polyangia bacterium]|nr:hypothetical protein [Polyangia bacterium]